MRHRQQRGMTLIGILFVLAVIGVFVLAAVRLAPAFLEYMTVAKALDSLKTNADATSPALITRAIEKELDIGDVKSINAKDVEVTRQDGNYIVHAAYDYTAPFIANVNFLVHFDKTVDLAAQ